MKSNSACFAFAIISTLCVGSAWAALPYGKFIAGGPRHKPYVAFTFDDGPGEATKELLDILSAYNAKATFFMLGSSVENYASSAKAVAEAGHLVANHTYSHSNFNKVPAEQRGEKLQKEIMRTAALVEKATGARTHFLRMPYGVTGKWIYPIAAKTEHVVVNWDYGADWQPRPREELLKEYVDSLRPGIILLFHDGGRYKRDTTLWIVKRVLEETKKRNLKAVRLDTLFGFDEAPKSAKPGQITKSTAPALAN